jgi:hypothetical protein
MHDEYLLLTEVTWENYSLDSTVLFYNNTQRSQTTLAKASISAGERITITETEIVVVRYVAATQVIRSINRPKCTTPPRDLTNRPAREAPRVEY